MLANRIGNPSDQNCKSKDQDFEFFNATTTRLELLSLLVVILMQPNVASSARHLIEPEVLHHY